MKVKSKNDFFRIILLFISTNSFGGDYNLDKQKEALSIITETAIGICQTISFDGSERKLKITGDMKAKLGKLVKKIADIGVEGVGEYKDSEYTGILQKDVPQTYKNSIDCRLKVFMELKDKLLNIKDSDKEQVNLEIEKRLKKIAHEEDNIDRKKLEVEVKNLKSKLAKKKELEHEVKKLKKRLQEIPITSVPISSRTNVLPQPNWNGRIVSELPSPRIK